MSLKKMLFGWQVLPKPASTFKNKSYAMALKPDFTKLGTSNNVNRAFPLFPNVSRSTIHSNYFTCRFARPEGSAPFCTTSSQIRSEPKELQQSWTARIMVFDLHGIHFIISADQDVMAAFPKWQISPKYFCISNIKISTFSAIIF